MVKLGKFASKVLSLLGILLLAGLTGCQDLSQKLLIASPQDLSSVVQEVLNVPDKERLEIVSRVAAHIIDSDTDRRQRAIWVISTFPLESCPLLPVLEKQLTNPSADVRLSVLEAMGSLGLAAGDRTAAIGPLVDDSDPRIREVAVRVGHLTGNLPPQEIRLRLSELHTSSDPERRQMASLALSNPNCTLDLQTSGMKPSSASMSGHCSASDVEIRPQVNALIRGVSTEDREAWARLMQAAANPSPHVRLLLLKTILHEGPKPAFEPILVKAAQDSQEPIHSLALTALRKWPNPGPDTLTLLGSMTTTAAQGRRDDEKTSLNEIDTDPAILQTVYLLENGDSQMRQQAMLHLPPASAHSRRVIKALTNIVNSGYDSAQRARAVWALGPLSADNKDLLDRFIQWSQDWSPDVRRQAYGALVYHTDRPDKVIPVLAEGLRSSNASVQRQADYAAYFFGPAAANLASDIASELDSRTPENRLIAACSLTAIRGLEALPILKEHTDDRSSEVRTQIAKEIAWLEKDAPKGWHRWLSKGPTVVSGTPPSPPSNILKP